MPSAYQHGGYGTYGPVVEPASPRNGLPRWAATLMAVVLLGGFGVIGYSAFVQNAVPSNQTATTTGTVNRCFFSSSSGFYNTATFRVGEETYSAQTMSGHSRECVYSDGQNVTVNYDPHNPTSASIALDYPAQAIGHVVFGFGIVFAIFTVVRRLFRRRGKAFR